MIATKPYRDDLAHIHDTGFGKFAEHAALVLLHYLRRAGMNHGLVVDLGCGSGILAQNVVAVGYDVLGIDLSGAMLATARKRVPSGRSRRGSFLKADIPPCIAVTAIGEVFNYLFDKQLSRSITLGVSAHP